MDREESEQDAVYKRYIIDDGWNLPIEVIELIDLCVEVAWNDAYRDVCKNMINIGEDADDTYVSNGQ